MLPRAIHCDAPAGAEKEKGSKLAKVIKSAVAAPEGEIKKWRRTFDVNAKTVVEGEK